MAGVVTTDPARLLERFHALPAAQPLDARLRSGPADVHLVGGAVRDLILGREPRELDLVVESDLEPVVLALAGEQHQFQRFGTATIRRDGFVYDVARARSETYERPGALPIVSPGDLATDLRRRDFTVNAIALGVYGSARGGLAAPEHASEDLAAGRLRVLHPASFLDDPTRLLRLIRYASRLGFEVEPATFELAEEAVGGGALDTVSGNRLGAELRLAASEADPIAGVAALGPLGIDAALAPGFGLSEPEPARRALELLPGDGDQAALMIAAAALGMESLELDRMLARLAFSARSRETIRAAALRAPVLADTLAAAPTGSEVAAAVGAAPAEAVALAGGLAAQRAGDGERAARRWLDEWRLVSLEIDGDDLLAAGVARGPAIGAGLRAALAAKLDGRARGAEAELAEALKAAALA
jgi:tRNA nucleotidyltransferase (CCA-adding enzyme)